MLSSQNVAIVKIPFHSRIMAFSNNHLLFVLMGKGIFNWQQWYYGAIDATPQAGFSSEEMHTLITFMVSVMASNTVDGL